MKSTLPLFFLAMAFVSPASADPVERDYQAVMHVRSSHAILVLDSPSHVVGIGEFRGVAIFDDDEVAVHRYDGWFDLIDGEGSFHGYALWHFDDGSEIRAPYTGTASNISEHGVEVVATFDDFTGTGRFEGVTGEGSFKGERLEPIDVGGATVLNGTIVLNLPD